MCLDIYGYKKIPIIIGVKIIAIIFIIKDYLRSLSSINVEKLKNTVPKSFLLFLPKSFLQKKKFSATQERPNRAL